MPLRKARTSPQWPKRPASIPSGSGPWIDTNGPQLRARLTQGAANPAHANLRASDPRGGSGKTGRMRPDPPRSVDAADPARPAALAGRSGQARWRREDGGHRGPDAVDMARLHSRSARPVAVYRMDEAGPLSLHVIAPPLADDPGALDETALAALPVKAHTQKTWRDTPLPEHSA